MRYFAEFDNNGNRTAGYLADGLPLSAADIQRLHPSAVELTSAQYEQFILCGKEIIRDANGRIIERPPQTASLDEAKAIVNWKIDQKAAALYTKGFYSEASGQRLWYDSDRDTQSKIAGIYQQTKEADWDTLERYPGMCPAGKAPIRAKSSEESPSADKNIQQLDAAQIKILADDLGLHLFSVNVWVWTKKQEVAEALTAEQVFSVVI